MSVYTTVVLRFELIFCLSFVGALTLSAFGDGSGAVFLNDVECSGLEERLEHCSHRGIGVHDCGNNGVFTEKTDVVSGHAPSEHQECVKCVICSTK